MSMLRRAGLWVAAMAALPIGAQEPTQVCVGTYQFGSYVRCEGAPGNVVYAYFESRGKVRIEGKFSFAYGDAFSPAPKQSVQATVTLDPGPPEKFEYRGNGLRVELGKRSSGRVVLDANGSGQWFNLGPDPRDYYRRDFPVVVTSPNGKRWNFRSDYFVVTCTIE